MTVEFTEREALRQMVDYIQQERLRLWEEYTRIVKRLQELDKEEKKTNNFEEIKLDLKNESEDLKESMTLQEAIAKHNTLHGYKEENTSVTQGVKYNSELELAKDIENKNRVVKTPTRRSKYRDVKQVAKEVAFILKEAGKPIRISKIIEELVNKGYSGSSPYALIQQVMTHEPRIQRVKHGYYQYKW